MHSCDRCDAQLGDGADTVTVGDHHSEQWCGMCIEANFGVRGTGRLRDEVRHYVTAKTVAAFCAGSLGTLLVAVTTIQ